MGVEHAKIAAASIYCARSVLDMTPVWPFNLQRLLGGTVNQNGKIWSRNHLKKQTKSQSLKFLLKVLKLKDFFFIIIEIPFEINPVWPFNLQTLLGGTVNQNWKIWSRNHLKMSFVVCTQRVGNLKTYFQSKKWTKLLSFNFSTYRGSLPYALMRISKPSSFERRMGFWLLLFH